MNPTPGDFVRQNSSNEIVEKLKVLDVNTLTPIEAMGVLYELTKSAKEI